MKTYVSPNKITLLSSITYLTIMIVTAITEIHVHEAPNMYVRAAPNMYVRYGRLSCKIPVNPHSAQGTVYMLSMIVLFSLWQTQRTSIPAL